MSKLNWVHISDFHFKPEFKDDYEKNDMFDKFIIDLSSIKKEIGQIDFLFITGDIAYHGNSNEYEIFDPYFKRIIDVLQIELNRVIIVPGNHDVNQPKASKPSRLTVKDITDQNKVVDLFKDEDDLNLIFSKFEDFSDYYTHVYGKDSTKIYNHHFFEDIGGHPVEIFALNSAWGCDEENGNRIGEVLVGKSQIDDMMLQKKNATIKIAVLHHPLEWLKGFDNDYVSGILHDYCDFILHGHLHKERVILTNSLIGNVRILSVGSMNISSRHGKTYGVVTFDLNTRTGKTILRRYSDSIKEWVKDVISTGDRLNGEVPISLKLSDNLKPPFVFPDDHSDILNFANFDGYIDSVRNNLGITNREFYRDRIDEFYKSFNKFPSNASLSILEGYLFKALEGDSQLKMHLETIKNGLSEYSDQTLVISFTKYLMTVYNMGGLHD